MIRSNKIHQVLLLLGIAGLFTSCGKDLQTKPDLQDGKSTVIYDLAGDVEASMGTDVDGKEKRTPYTFLFRFSDQKQIWIKTKADSSRFLQTSEWDIAFTGPYNSEIYLNNALAEYSPGFGGTADKTSIIMLKQSYENIVEAPSDALFDQSSISMIGWSANENSPGWFTYSLNYHLMQALPNRTYVLRLPDGKYAKLQILNAYKGNPPAVTNVNWPAPYYTFRYFVQKDGSKNLNTK